MSTTSDTNPGLQAYARNRGELLEILNSLHSAGIQNDVDLPQVVVLGSQSVGKSSLIESMSGLKLPRDAGTCTRCPMECRLQNAPVSSTDITLRFTKDSANQDLREHREVSFRTGLTDPMQVKDALRDAQRAILQPGLLDIGLGAREDPPLSFTENCVCIHVMGPHVPDLYFYDLPGLIATVSDGGDRKDIDLVLNLAKKYVSRPNCIVLLVIACNYEINNQGAGIFVLDDVELRRRTVGVLTKADKVDEGTEDTWIKLLKNNTIALENGWFAVKQPSQTELGLGWEEARQREREFFSSREPWNTLDVDHKQRLGSQQLAEHLSRLLSDLVAQKLPKIHRDVARLLHQTDNDLAELPERNFDDPRKEIIALICEFNKKISVHVVGLPPKFRQKTPGLIQAINGVFENFQLEVYRTAPQFRPWAKELPHQLDQRTVNEMIKSASFDDVVDESGTVIYLDEVKDLALRSRTRELPGDIPHSVKVTLIEEFMTTWSVLVKNCFETVEDILTRHVNTILRQHFAAYAHGGLLDEVNIIVQQQMYRSAWYTKQQIDALCHMDLQPYTQNEQFYNNCRKKLYLRYKAVYQKSRESENQPGFIELLQSNAIGRGVINATIGPELSIVLDGLAKLGIPGIQPSDLVALLPNDELDLPLVIMADVRAYFQVAYKRFADIVPKVIDNEFLRAFATSVGIALLQMDLSNTRCMQFLQEAPDRRQLREEILGRKKRLEVAKDKLDRIFMPTPSQPSSPLQDAETTPRGLGVGPSSPLRDAETTPRGLRVGPFSESSRPSSLASYPFSDLLGYLSR